LSHFVTQKFEIGLPGVASQLQAWAEIEKLYGAPTVVMASTIKAHKRLFHGSGKVNSDNRLLVPY
jgi:hypothetical protein